MQKVVNKFTQSAIETNKYTVSNIRHYKIISSLGQSKNMTKHFAPQTYKLDIYDIL